jgi:EF-P beta-lysylation protein EpmB
MIEINQKLFYSRHMSHPAHLEFSNFEKTPSLTASHAISSWRMIQQRNFKKWEDLFLFLQLEEPYRLQILQAPQFPLNLPQRLAQKIAKNTWNDPILRQFLPTLEETKLSQNFSQDPVRDASFQMQKKLLKKYQNRALLLTSSACAMNCRFCFRQNFDYETEIKGFEEELREIEKDRTLSEIILSGGDPLSLSNRALEELIQNLGAIPHVKRLRFHTRFPIGIPERIDGGFLSLLSETRLQVFFTIHCNHPRELDTDILSALKNIQRLGIPVLNQAVLLKGVNDDIDTLQALCEKLVDCGILPYYLHQLDKVQKAAHFEVDKKRGSALIRELNNRISGYGVPRYVSEVPGAASKTHLN